jgi:hypothetical protein
LLDHAVTVADVLLFAAGWIVARVVLTIARASK